ncbi:MAG: phosphonomutase [Actinomycetia bacterium]|nr:phosphonomutase [Actinomycetes bacterium]
MTLNERARRLRALHDDLLVLPNVWDAASAQVVADAGATAIATGSAGVAWSLGLPDGQKISRSAMAEAVARITAVVDLPVTADIEGGYGPAPDDVAATVTEIIRAGAVGINLEDGPAPLFDVEAQAARIRAARDAADAAGVPDFFINARTDVHLYQVGDLAGRPAEVLARARVYAAAGGDCLFVPGLLDLAALETLVAASPLPVNVLAKPDGPTVKELATVGVRRMSLGGSLMLATYAAAHRAAKELLANGTYDAFPDDSAARAVLARF